MANILLAIIFPPLYFLLNKQIGKALITGFMFIVALLMAIMIVFIWVSLILWFIAAIMALRDIKRKAVAANIDMLTTKMAEKMRKD